MLTHYFNIALAHIVIGFAAALFYTYILKKDPLGNFWAALALAVVGAFFGGLADLFLGNFLSRLSNIADAVNVFPALFASLLVLWLLSKFRRDE